MPRTSSIGLAASATRSGKVGRLVERAGDEAGDGACGTERRPHLRPLAVGDDRERADGDDHCVPRADLHERLRLTARGDVGRHDELVVGERVPLRPDEELAEWNATIAAHARELDVGPLDEQRRQRVPGGRRRPQVAADRPPVADLRRTDCPRGLRESRKQPRELVPHRLLVGEPRPEPERPVRTRPAPELRDLVQVEHGLGAHAVEVQRDHDVGPALYRDRVRMGSTLSRRASSSERGVRTSTGPSVLRSAAWTPSAAASPSPGATSRPTSSCAEAASSPSSRSEWLETDVAIADGVVAGLGEYDGRETCSTPPGAGSFPASSTHTCTSSRRSCCRTSSRGSCCRSGRPPSSPTRTSSRTSSAPTASTGCSTRAWTCPLDFFFMASSCVPASSFESPRRPLSTGDLESLLRRKRVLGVAEMMNFPGVIAGDEAELAKLDLEERGHVDGHAPGVLGKELNAYAAAGIGSDHEALTVEEGRERLRAGMWLLVREASMARNLRALLPLVQELGTNRIAFCTDDRDPEDIAENGHINGMVREAVAFGIAAEDAIVLASLQRSALARARPARRGRPRLSGRPARPARPRAVRALARAQARPRAGRGAPPGGARVGQAVGSDPPDLGRRLPDPVERGRCARHRARARPGRHGVARRVADRGRRRRGRRPRTRPREDRRRRAASRHRPDRHRPRSWLRARPRCARVDRGARRAQHRRPRRERRRHGASPSLGSRRSAAASSRSRTAPSGPSCRSRSRACSPTRRCPR